MSCEPLTCCSMGAATDCATTSALAPGKLVVTVTCGGTTCGYCAIGSSTAASTPTRIMMSAMTVEKTGRSMKKLNIGYFLLRRRLGATGTSALRGATALAGAATGFTGAPG